VSTSECTVADRFGLALSHVLAKTTRDRCKRVAAPQKRRLLLLAAIRIRSVA